MPVTLRGGGVIVKWQTTSCTVQARDGASWRIRGAGRVETRRTSAEFTGAELVATHPILDDHDAPQAELYVSSVAREDDVSRALADRVHAATAGWRDFADYVSRLDVLAGGHGLLMRGPKPLALACAETLAALGVRHNVLDAWTPKQRHVALILGENFIIAESFRFDPT